MQVRAEQIWQILESVCDPEVPVLSVVDLGIVRGVECVDNKVIVTITPTYSGCPAMDMIAVNIKAGIQAHFLGEIEVKNVWSPAWTTDWMSEAGKQKLKAYGIAPPIDEVHDKMELFGKTANIECPLCHSENTTLISQFGSTACKALYKCEDCKEPFDYFKCHR